jgi:hypothetical protein
MDAAEYKHVVLGLIFLKYISDAFEERHAQLVAEKAHGADPEDPWLNSSAPPAAPQNEHLATFWTLRGASDKDLTCAAYRVDTGLELRAGYDANTIVATELFRGNDADARARRASGHVAVDAASQGVPRDRATGALISGVPGG